MESRPADDFALGTTIFSAVEPAELTEYGRALSFSAEYVATGRAFRADVVSAQAAHSQLIQIGFHAPSIGMGEPPPNTFVFVLPLRLGGRTHVGGEVFDPSGVGIFHPGREYQFHLNEFAEFVLVSASREHVERISRARWGRSLEETGGHSVWRVRDPRVLRGLSSRYLARLDRALASPRRLVQLDAALDLGETLLDVLIAQIQPREGRIPLRHTAARRAELFLRSNWRRPLRLADIREAAGAPERTLRQGFAELYGCSPTVYLRLLRHRAVRTVLQRADAGRISDIALSCGFKNLGDFTIEYRHLFGETPSATRREACSA